MLTTCLQYSSVHFRQLSWFGFFGNLLIAWWNNFSLQYGDDLHVMKEINKHQQPAITCLDRTYSVRNAAPKDKRSGFYAWTDNGRNGLPLGQIIKLLPQLQGWHFPPKLPHVGAEFIVQFSYEQNCRIYQTNVANTICRPTRCIELTVASFSSSYLPIVHIRILWFSKFLVLSRIVRLAHTYPNSQ